MHITRSLNKDCHETRSRHASLPHLGSLRIPNMSGILLCWQWHSAVCVVAVFLVTKERTGGAVRGLKCNSNIDQITEQGADMRTTSAVPLGLLASGSARDHVRLEGCPA